MAPNGKISLSRQALMRMPEYLQYLKQLDAEGVVYISSAKAAEQFKLSEIQVRKDFAAVSSEKGRPRAGFSVSSLIADIEAHLGIASVNEAVLVGVGSLGRALLSYNGFDEYGVRIIAGFDNKPHSADASINGIPIFPSSSLSSVCRSLRVRIGIITVPAKSAQMICDQLVEGGIMAILNFAPVQLTVPDGILVQNENMAVSLALLSKHLQDSMGSA